MLVLDLGIFHRREHTVRFREALGWSVMWIALAGAFAVLVYFWHGRSATLEFVTGYVIELSLSVDNLFVFLVIFRYFRVPNEQQHKVLFWGILGALIMRAIFILAGVGLIRRFHWIVYFFGVLLVYSGIKLLSQEDADIRPEKNPVLRIFRRLVPVTKNYVGGKFFVRSDGLSATPLLIVLLVVESTDLLFAVDSIPAVFAVTTKPFIVFTSNIFAILGLRSLYFVLAGAIGYFRYLKVGLSVVLVFIGVKMLLDPHDKTPMWFQVDVPISVSLLCVGGIILVSIAASLVSVWRTEEKGHARGPGKGTNHPGSTPGGPRRG